MTMHRGEVYDTGRTERLVVRVGTAESGGQRLLADLYVRPGGGRVPPHVHPTIEESFTVIHGELGTSVAGKTRVLSAGEGIRIPPGTPHSWWSVGSVEARVLFEVHPAGRFEEQWRQFMGLQQDGKTNARGVPSFLQIMAILRAFPDVGYMAGLPLVLQRVLFALLAPIVRARGYEGRHEAYLTRAPSATVDLEPLPDYLRNRT